MRKLLTTLVLGLVLTANAAEKPKYGPEITLLSEAHEHIQKNPAPDFWALIPYYAAQANEASCSVASVVMVLNASRRSKELGSEEKLISQKELLKRVNDPMWKRNAEGMLARGVTLDQLGKLIEKSFTSYGLKGVRAEVFHADASPELAAKLHAMLVTNEKSAKDFIIANFDQEVFTGDTHVGHIAPVAAYDEVKKRVLVLDPDREWYEPYWVSEETFLKGMMTQDRQAGKNRGWVWVRVRE